LGAELLEVVSWDAGAATVQADESVQQAGHFLERLLLPGKPERGATSRQLDLECVPKDLRFLSPGPKSAMASSGEAT